MVLAMTCEIKRWGNKPRLTINDVFPERPHVCRNDRKTEAVRQVQHTALTDLGIRQHQDVRCFEIQLRLLIGDEFNLPDDLLPPQLAAD